MAVRALLSLPKGCIVTILRRPRDPDETPVAALGSTPVTRWVNDRPPATLELPDDLLDLFARMAGPVSHGYRDSVSLQRSSSPALPVRATLGGTRTQSAGRDGQVRERW